MTPLFPPKLNQILFFSQVQRETTLHGAKSAEKKTPTTTLISNNNKCIQVSFVIFYVEQNLTETLMYESINNRA